MNITFVLPSLGVSGGTRVVVDHAVRLRKMGHSVRVVTPILPPESLLRRAKTWLREFSAGGMSAPARPNALVEFGAEYLTHAAIPLEAFQDCFPDGDVVVATWWETAEFVDRLPERCGVKAYFIQGDEASLPFVPSDRVVATLRTQLHKFTVSQFLGRAVRKRADVEVEAIVPNGVDTDFFRAPPRARNRTPTLGFVYSCLQIKGVDIIVAALRLVREHHPELRLRSFGGDPISPDLQLPDWVEFTFRPSQSELVKIYSSCDAWIWGSRSEGFGLPILEAMACRTPVVATVAGAAPEILAKGGGKLVPCDDATAMAGAILEILAFDDDRWRLLSDEAHSIAQTYGSVVATEQVEKFLLGIVSKSRD